MVVRLPCFSCAFLREKWGSKRPLQKRGFRLCLKLRIETWVGGTNFYLPSTRSIPEKSNSSLARGSLPARSVSRDLSSEISCDTLATESFSSPVTRADKLTLPGARAHFRLLVSGTQTTVEISALVERVALYNCYWPTEPWARTGRAGKSAHQMSPCEITTRSAPAACGKPPLRRDRFSHRFQREPDPWPR